MKIAVGSKNPVKINAVAKAFSKYFDDVDVIGLNAESNVSKQPFNDETFEGAKNRVKFLKKNVGADYYVGIEGGIYQLYHNWFGCGVVYIDNGEMDYYSISNFFPLPNSVITQIRENNLELGDVVDSWMNEKNTKQKYGAIGFLTKNEMDREKLYVDAVISALIPFINQMFYFK